MANRYPVKFKQADLARREIQLIHIAKQQLGMDDETYRAMLWTVARVKSSTELDFAGRKKVLDHLKACGFKVVASKNAGKPANVKADLAPLIGKIGALLADMKLPWAYLTASRDGSPSMLKRIAGVDKLEWANAKGLHDLVTALVIRQARVLAPERQQGKTE